MKIKVEYGEFSETEVVLRCRKGDAGALALESLLREHASRLTAYRDDETFLVEPRLLFYAESVDGKTFVYTQGQVLETKLTLALQWFIGGICFLASCVFNDSRKSLAVGVGVPLFSYVLQMIGNFSPKLEGFRYASFFTLFDQKGLAAGAEPAIAGSVILLAGAVVFYLAAAVAFTKKDIPV